MDRDYIYVITTWSQPQLVEKAINSLLPEEPYWILNVKELGLKSLAQGWNQAIDQFVVHGHFKAVILMADDVESVEPKPTGRLLFRALKDLGPQYGVLMTVGYDVNLWGNLGWVMVPGTERLPGSFCMCITKDLIDKVGYFDERFERAWFEDSDMWRRIYLKGFQIASVAPVLHVGEATSKLDPEVADAKLKYYPQNMERYISKWGGMPGKETFQEPHD